MLILLLLHVLFLFQFLFPQTTQISHTAAMEDECREAPVDIGIGMNIGQDQIDDIDDLQSPPNSPGLVLPGTVPSTNDRIDFFALDSPSVSGPTSLVSSTDTINNLLNQSVIGTPDSSNECTAAPSTPSPIINIERSSNDDDEEGRSTGRVTALGITRRRASDNYSEKSNDEYNDHPALNLNLMTSSDSYYSRSRKGGLPVSTKSRNRRTSDVSDKSDRSVRSDFYGSVGSSGSGGSYDSGSINGSFVSESDMDVYGSPILKHVNRKSRSQMSDIIPMKSLGDDVPSSHFDDGVVYRALSDISDSAPSTPVLGGSRSGTRSGSRSSSRSRSGSRQRREGKEGEKDKDGDSSATSQIFKNMLIMEESLRQQYIQQQTLRYRYSVFLFVMIAIFTYSTYMSLMYPVNTGHDHIMMMNGLGVDDMVVNSIEAGHYGMDFNVGGSDFPTVSEMDGIVDNGDADEGILGDEMGDIGEPDAVKYTLMNIIHRVFSITMFMTLILFYLTGEYTRTISIPRKFLITANKGIRQLNLRLVKVKVPLKDRILGYVDFRMQHNHHEGVDHVRLVLNPRVFSTATREQWELYRNQFWGLESVRNRTKAYVSSSAGGKKNV